MFKSTCLLAAGLFFLVLTMTACSSGSKGKTKGVVEGYKPEKPIAFSHEIHAGKNKIDCQYCHNSSSNGKDVPATDLCINCHKQITGRTGDKP